MGEVQVTDAGGRVPYRIGDVVRLRKAHPCGSTDWEVIRTGIDFGLRCLGCGHRVMIPRRKFERAVKQVLEHGDGIPRLPGMPRDGRGGP